jgi:hypothetical protein
LLCHNDEQGAIYIIDYRSGEILKRFYLGKVLVYRDDLEGIATKGDTIFMVNSSGTLLRFGEGQDKEKVRFETFKTPLTARNDVEGLAYDPKTDCLLLVCKGEAGIGYGKPLPKDQKAVYAFSLRTYKLLPPMAMPLWKWVQTAISSASRLCPNPSIRSRKAWRLRRTARSSFATKAAARRDVFACIRRDSMRNWRMRGSQIAKILSRANSLHHFKGDRTP